MVGGLSILGTLLLSLVTITVNAQTRVNPTSCGYWYNWQSSLGCITIKPQIKNYEFTEFGMGNCSESNRLKDFRWDGLLVRFSRPCCLESWNDTAWCAATCDKNEPAQHWRKLPQGKGAYKIQSILDGRCLTMTEKFLRVRPCNQVGPYQNFQEFQSKPCPVSRTTTTTTRTTTKTTTTKRPPTPSPDIICKGKCCKYKEIKDSDTYDTLPNGGPYPYSLQECIAKCSANTACNGFAWTGRTCTFKRIRIGSTGPDDIFPGPYSVYVQNCAATTTTTTTRKPTTTERRTSTSRNPSPSPDQICLYNEIPGTDAGGVTAGVGPTTLLECRLGCDKLTTKCNAFTWNGQFCVYKLISNSSQLVPNPNWSTYTVDPGCRFFPNSITTLKKTTTTTTTTFTPRPPPPTTFDSVTTTTVPPPPPPVTTTTTTPANTDPPVPPCVLPDGYTPAVFCHKNASCVSKKCYCNCGFEGDGLTCSPTTCADKCDVNACCINRQCRCKPGFTGNGLQCAEAGSAIMGTIWLDKNINGQYDPGECGWAGITVALYNIDTGMLIDRTNTGPKGLYMFRDLRAGKYRVLVDEMTIAEGYMLTYTVDKQQNVVGQSDVTLDPNEETADVDFGYGPDPAAYQAPVSLSC